MSARPTVAVDQVIKEANVAEAIDLAPNVPTANKMSDIKTSLKPTAPVLSKRYSKSARYVRLSHRIPSSFLTQPSLEWMSSI